MIQTCYYSVDRNLPSSFINLKLICCVSILLIPGHYSGLLCCACIRNGTVSQCTVLLYVHLVWHLVCMWYLTSLYVVLLLLAVPTSTFCTRCSIKPFMLIPILHRVVPNSTSLFLSLSCEVRSCSMSSHQYPWWCWCRATCKIDVWPLLRE